MGWERETLRLGADEISASVKRAGQRVEAVIPWRPGIAVGARVALDDGRYAVLGIRDPGERHEVLELVLAWVSAGPAAKPTPTASGERRGREPSPPANASRPRKATKPEIMTGASDGE